jgi:hypothetical protein
VGHAELLRAERVHLDLKTVHNILTLLLRRDAETFSYIGAGGKPLAAGEKVADLFVP